MYVSYLETVRGLLDREGVKSTTVEVGRSLSPVFCLFGTSVGTEERKKVSDVDTYTYKIL